MVALPFSVRSIAGLTLKWSLAAKASSMRLAGPVYQCSMAVTFASESRSMRVFSAPREWVVTTLLRRVGSARMRSSRRS